MTSLNNRRNHNPQLQALYDDDDHVAFEFIVFEDRELAYDHEQFLIDTWLGHPLCLNVNNNARTVWSTGTKPAHLRQRSAEIASIVHAGNKYALGTRRTEESLERLRESITSYWDRRGRVDRPERPQRPGARGRIVTGTVLENMRSAAIARGIENSRSVTVDGVIHVNATWAARSLGVSRRTVIVRIADARYPTWKYTDE